jgi:hypothetical protein
MSKPGKSLFFFVDVLVSVLNFATWVQFLPLSLSLSLSVRALALFIGAFALSAVGYGAEGEAPLPFQTDFESSEGYTTGPLLSDPTWSFGGGLDASIVAPGAASNQALSFSGSDHLAISFIPSGSSISWIDYYLKPEFSPLADLPGSYDPSRAAATGFVLSNGIGEVFAVDGDGLGGGVWLGSGETYTLGVSDVAADWIRLSYRLDFTEKTWDLFIDSKLVLSDLGFLSNSASSLTDFYFDGSATSPTELDYFYAGDQNPLFTDTANDGIPDGWLLSHGLSVGTDQREGDPDGDGLTNLQEYMHSTDPQSPDSDGDGLSDAEELALGTDPNEADSDGDGLSDSEEIALEKNPLEADVDGLAGFVRLDTWYELVGFGIKPMTDLAVFPTLPNESALTEELDLPPPGNAVDHYGQRVYGWLVAPETGNYVFAAAASGISQLWLSSDASPSNRDLVLKLSSLTEYQEWDVAPQAVHLEAGQAYFFEFLYHHREGDDFWSIGWSYAGNPVAPITSEHLQVHMPEAGDSDQDGLPDSWEIAHGLDPLKGYGKNGYNGDFDRDGIPNYKEREYGTHPGQGDTDGDGYNDGLEVYSLYSNPTVAEFIRSEAGVVASLDGAAFIDSRGLWQREGSIAYAVDATGSLTYDLSLPASGAYKMVVEFTEHNASTSGGSLFEMEARINGRSLGQEGNFASYGSEREFVFYLPFLEAGVHSLELVWANGLQLPNSSLEVQSVRLENFGGIDSDGSGVADWVESRAAKFGSETAPTEVYVSPFFFEGRSFSPELIDIQSYAAGDPQSTRDETVREGLQYTYYTDVLLDPDEPRVLEIVDQSGLRTVEHTLTWEAFNLYEHDLIHIRKDGSLLIEAVDPQGAIAQEVTLEIEAPDGSVESHLIPAGGRLQALFDEAGDWSLSTTIPPVGDDDPIVLDSTVRVSSASLQPAPVLVGIRERTWIPSLSGTDIELTFDAGLQLLEIDPGGSPRTFRMSSSRDDARIVARLPDGGPILDVTAANVIQDLSRSQTYNSIVETFDDGSALVSAYIYLSEVPEDLSIDIQVWKSGVTFEDGTVWRTITAEDFDELGRYRFYMLRSPGVSGGNCHRYWIQQDGQDIGQL